MAQPQDDSIGGRIGGLFRSRSMGPQQGAQQQEIAELQAELHTCKESEAKLRAETQRLEREKSLLKAFVENVWGDDADADDDDGKASEEAKLRLSELASSCATLEQTKETLEAENAELAKNLKTAEKKCVAFEAALDNANSELRVGDEKLKEANDQVTQQTQQDRVLEAVTAELESKNNTIEEMMARVARLEKEKKQSDADFAAILAKTTTANDDSLAEIDALKAQNAELAKELTAVRATAAGAETATATATAAEVDALKSDHAAAIAKLTAELEESRGEFEGEKGRLQAALRNQQEETATEKTALEEQLEALKQQLSDSKSELEAAQQSANEELEKVRQEVTEHQDDADQVRVLLLEKENAMHNIEAALETATMEGRASEDRRKRLTEELEGSEKLVTELQATLEAAQEAANELQTQKAALEGELRSVADETAELEIRNEELQRQLDDAENDFKNKSRTSANIVKELQQQVLKLQQRAEASEAIAATSPVDATPPRAMPSAITPVRHVDPTDDGASPSISDSVLQQENTALIDKVADLQQKVWVLDEAKKVYEQEMVRLNESLRSKDQIITAHFVESAKKHNEGKGKFGASFFKPSAEEVVARMQVSLQDALADNLDLHQQLRDRGQSLDRALRVIDRAEEEGFVVVDDEMEEGEDDMGFDPDYEGTFE